MEIFDEIDEFLSNAKVSDFEEISFDNILTTAEVEKLIMSIATKRGEEGFAEEEAFQIIKWAEGVRIQEALLTLVLKGLASVDLNKDNEPVFSLTKKGKKAADG